MCLRIIINLCAQELRLYLTEDRSPDQTSSTNNIPISNPSSESARVETIIIDHLTFFLHSSTIKFVGENGVSSSVSVAHIKNFILSYEKAKLGAIEQLLQLQTKVTKEVSELRAYLEDDYNEW